MIQSKRKETYPYSEGKTSNTSPSNPGKKEGYNIKIERQNDPPFYIKHISMQNEDY